MAKKFPNYPHNRTYFWSKISTHSNTGQFFHVNSVSSTLDTEPVQTFEHQESVVALKTLISLSLANDKENLTV